MAVTQQAAGQVTAPGAGAALATIAAGVLPAGHYRVRTVVAVSNNAVADLGNVELRRGGVAYQSPVPTGANGQPEDNLIEDMTLDGTQALTLNAIGAGTAAIEYDVQLEAQLISA